MRKDFAQIEETREREETKQKPNNKKLMLRMFSLLGWIIATALVVYFTSKPTEIDLPKSTEVTDIKTSANSKPKIEQKEQLEEIIIPAKTKERFDYYDVLQNPSEEVDKLEVLNKPKWEYWLRSELLNSENEAEELKMWLVLQGLEKIQKAKYKDESNVIWHRVRLGPFYSRSQMNRARDLLSKKDLDSILERKKILLNDSDVSP